MSMGKFSKRMTMLLALVSVLFCLAISAYAEDATGHEPKTVEWVGTIASIADLNEAAQAEEPESSASYEAAQEITYTVTFMNWDDTEIFTFSLAAGQSVENPMFFSPVRDGYNFEYWFAGDSAQEAFVFGEPVEKDLVISAFFSEIETQPATEPETEAPALEEAEELSSQEVTSEVIIDKDESADNTFGTLEVIIIEDLALEVENEPEPETEALPEGEPEVQGDVEDDELLIIEDDELFIIEDDEIPLAGPALVSEVTRAVNISSSMSDTINENEMVTLTGELIGFEGCNVSLQWQYDNGFGWTDVSGANELTHTFPATVETVNSAWRLSVTING